MYEASLSCITTTKTYVSNREENILPPDQTGIVHSGATHMYIGPNAPYGQMNTTTKKIIVGTSNGQVAITTEMATLPIPQLDTDFPTKGYIMPTFTHTLIVVGPICDADCTVVFKKEDFKVISPMGKPILKGWREKKRPRLWRFSLSTDEIEEKKYTTTSQTGLEANIVYDLLRYMHAAAISPLKSTWLKAIKHGVYMAEGN